ncbi:MAG: hypothetical protein ABWY06_22445 [Pseudomonas sp.]|uniref:hypothetical protein n=1 Tax=Pseudomonas sp. TaxID=306 RepID=UPI0033934EB3
MQAFTPELQLPKKAEPEPEPMVPVKKLEPVVVAPAPAVLKPVVKKNPTPVAPSKAPAVEQAEVPKAPLDLRLPAELVDSLQPKDQPRETDTALLPPMFGEKVGDDPFQLNGRLITKEREDVIEGAELQFEFKR